MVKIVHINATDKRGGAAIACARLNEALIRAGIQSSMVVANHPSGINRILRSLFYRINNPRERRLRPTANFSLMNFGLPIYKSQLVQEADIIFLHWVCANTLSIHGIEKILELGKPTFWFMHDMFPFTGGCHYAMSCNGYKLSCANCPQIRNDSHKELAYEQLKHKIKHWKRHANLEFISPSKWEAECAKNATLCEGHYIHIAGNLLDTEVYRPLNMDCKNFFGLNKNKKTILFGATRINSPYKGAKYAHECLSLLDPNQFEGLVIGDVDLNFISDLPIKVVHTGFLSKDSDIAMAYNACDTFLMTSIAESFGQVVSEAMACGKPCVVFPTGGVVDLVHHEKTGYVTDSYNVSELKAGIDWLFSNKDRYEQLSKSCRQHILRYNSFNQVLNIHTELRPYLDV